MRRFVLCTALLLLTLLVARATQGGVHFDARHDISPGPTTERAAFFDHRVQPRAWASGDVAPESEDAPRARAGAIRFRFRDRGYHRVYLAGEVAAGGEVDSSGVALLPMRYDPGIDRWECSVPLDAGVYRYHFVVEDEEGERWPRVDPSNPGRRREGNRWVSELRVTRAGEVEIDPERRARRRSRNDYDLDPFARFGLSYQRVDGLMISARPRLATHEPFAPVFEGFVGYGFASERWSLQGTLLQPITPGGSLRLLLTGLDRTDFTDRTGMDDFENSLATLVFREDGRDWFRREGLGFGVELDVHEWLLARVEARSDTYRSLERRVHAGWAGREDFLPNPSVDEGVMRSLFSRVRIGSDLRHLWIEFEHADDDLFSTAFTFTQITAQVRTRLQMGRSHHLDLRARFGTALAGELPRQKRYLAGGIGTLRGFAYQSVLDGGDLTDASYGGERILLANAEYVMGSRSDLALACFVDTGNVWADRDADVFDGEWKTSIGLGLLLDGEGHGLRLDLARALDGSGAPIVQARLRRPF